MAPVADVTTRVEWSSPSPSTIAMMRVEVAAASVEEPRMPVPTWSRLYEEYFAAGTQGGCGRSSACHAAEMRDARTAYDWLHQRGYIDGVGSALASPSNSCLRWFGGNMPPAAKQPVLDSGAQAAIDLRAWVAAGAHDD
jgi:hypothetical protein